MRRHVNSRGTSFRDSSAYRGSHTLLRKCRSATTAARSAFVTGVKIDPETTVAEVRGSLSLVHDLHDLETLLRGIKDARSLQGGRTRAAPASHKSVRRMMICTDGYHVGAMRTWFEFLVRTDANRDFTGEYPKGWCAACGTPIVFTGKVPSEFDVRSEER